MYLPESSLFRIGYPEKRVKREIQTRECPKGEKIERMRVFKERAHCGMIGGHRGEKTVIGKHDHLRRIIWSKVEILPMKSAPVVRCHQAQTGEDEWILQRVRGILREVSRVELLSRIG